MEGIHGYPRPDRTDPQNVSSREEEGQEGQEMKTFIRNKPGTAVVDEGFRATRRITAEEGGKSRDREPNGLEIPAPCRDVCAGVPLVHVFGVPRI